MFTISAIRFTLKGHQTLNAAHLNLLFRISPTLGQASHDSTVCSKTPICRWILTLCEIGLHHWRSTLFLWFAESLHLWWIISLNLVFWSIMPILMQFIFRVPCNVFHSLPSFIFCFATSSVLAWTRTGRSNFRVASYKLSNQLLI